MAQLVPQAKSDAYIVYHNGTYLVRPSFIVIHGRELKLRIRNMTDRADVEVTLPVSRLQPGQDEKKSAKAQRGNDQAEFDLAPLEGCFEFKVKVAGQDALGESDPVIIIDPPAS